jgi:hypothetical protein
LPADDVALAIDVTPNGRACNARCLAMTDIAQEFATRGDLAHLALFLWAASATALSWFALRELAAASRRFDDFVRELARFNKRFQNRSGGL